MKVAFVFVPVLTLLLNPTANYAQEPKKSPMTIANEGVRDGGFSQECTVLDYNSAQIDLDGQSVVIYESGQNGRLFQNDPDLERRKQYVYDAGYRLTDVRYKSGKNTVSLTLSPNLPDKTKLVQALKGHRINVYLTPANLNPTCMLGYELRYEGAETYEVNCAGGNPMNQAIYPTLTFPTPEEAAEAASDLKEGFNRLHFAYAVALIQSHMTGINASTKNILKSEAYRDFVSPVRDSLITLNHARLVTAEIIRETNTDAYMEGDNPFLSHIFTDMWKQLVAVENQQIITFEQIANGTGAAQYLEDFEKNKRYATDEIEHIARDAEHLTDDEWCRKYKDKFRRDIDKMKKSNWNGGGGFSIGKLFGINGSHTRGKESRLIDQLEKVTSSEDCGKQVFKDAFHYEFDGKKYVPKGIIAHEFSQSMSKTSAIFVFNGRYYEHGIVPRTIDLLYQQ